LKKIGLVGGIAWLSTVEYYRGLCLQSEQRLKVRRRHGVLAMPEIIIESLDLHRAVAYIGKDDSDEAWSQFDHYHRAALRRLEVSGAEVAAIASFTAHHRLTHITRGIHIPVIDVFDIVARECARIGAQQALVLGTVATMNSARLRAVCAARGVAAAGPREPAACRSVQRLIDRLHRAKDLHTCGQRIDDIVRREATRQPDSRVVLACTELPLAFPAALSGSVFRRRRRTYVNATAAHIGALLDHADLR
jgi:aspartate racemase